MLGIFKSGVMAGALVLLMLNRLQMLKESRGQQCPDREGRRPRGESKHQTDPTGGRDCPPGHIRLLLSTLNHSSPFPSPSRRCVMRPFLPVSAPPPTPLIDTVSPKCTSSIPVSSFSSTLLITPGQAGTVFTALNSHISVCGTHRNIFTGNMNANECKTLVYFCSKSWLESSFLKAPCSGAKRNVQFPSI